MRIMWKNIEVCIFTFLNPCETSGLGEEVSNKFSLEFWKKSLLEFSRVKSSAVELSLVNEGRDLTNGLFLLWCLNQLNLFSAGVPGFVGVSGLEDGVPGVSSPGDGVSGISSVAITALVFGAEPIYVAHCMLINRLAQKYNFVHFH